MKYAIGGIVLLLSQAVMAQPAIFTDGTLTIPQGAVISADDGAYYADIELQLDANGRFTPVAVESRPLVAVDSVQVNIMESLPVQVSVTVNGNKSVPCVELLTPAVSYADQTFSVVLAESVLGPAETCIATIEPFETSIELNVEGLSAGTYPVRVNGVESQFTLDVDN